MHANPIDVGMAAIPTERESLSRKKQSIPSDGLSSLESAVRHAVGFAQAFAAFASSKLWAFHGTTIDMASQQLPESRRAESALGLN